MNKQGLTLIEVIMALAIIGLLLGVFSTTLTGNLRLSNRTGQQAQAAQVINYLGKRIIDGDTLVLPEGDSDLTWDYNSLETTFTDLTSKAGFADVDLYKATITNDGSISISTASLTQYTIQVCYLSSGSDICVQAVTIGPNYSGGGAAPTIIGIG